MPEGGSTRHYLLLDICLKVAFVLKYIFLLIIHPFCNTRAALCRTKFFGESNVRMFVNKPQASQSIYLNLLSNLKCSDNQDLPQSHAKAKFLVMDYDAKLISHKPTRHNKQLPFYKHLLFIFTPLRSGS